MLLRFFVRVYIDISFLFAGAGKSYSESVCFRYTSELVQ